MKHIGIDYGTKRVGVAVSDDAGRIAFPKMILPNNKMLMSDLVTFIKKEEVGAVVVGESKDLSGKENHIMGDIRTFAKEVERLSGVEVILEPEWYSSLEARKIGETSGVVDEHAAAIILQSYLAKHNTYDDFN